MRKALTLSGKQIVLDPKIDNSRPSTALINLHVEASTPPIPPCYLMSPTRSTKFHLSQELRKLELREQLAMASTASQFDDSVAGSSAQLGDDGNRTPLSILAENDLLRVDSTESSPAPSIARSTAPSVAPDANSLFTRTDQASLERYMQEIESQERSYDQTLSQCGDFEGTAEHPSLQSGYNYQELSTDSTPVNISNSIGRITDFYLISLFTAPVVRWYAVKSTYFSLQQPGTLESQHCGPESARAEHEVVGGCGDARGAAHPPRGRARPH